MEATSILPVAALTCLLMLLARPRVDPKQLRRIEHRLQLVMDHLGVVEAPSDHPEVVRWLEQGKKIAAIKSYRETTGVDLAEAKDQVETIARQRGL